MQLDCHYFAIYYLCIAAGLEPEEARIIAFSSQYVDDAKDGSEKVLVHRRTGKEIVFDPVRTAHNGLESPGTEVQQKVYFPFHFLPGLVGDDYEERMTTRAGHEGRLFGALASRAAGSGDPFRVGITAHVLADSFSHDGFSGNWTWVNDIEDVDFVPTSRSAAVNLFSSLSWGARRGWLNMAPPIGHAQAGTLPDLPCARWRYIDFRGKNRTVCNNDTFRRGLLVLYRELIREYAQGTAPRCDERDVCTSLWETVNIPGTSKMRCTRWKRIIRDLARLQEIEIPEDHLDYDEHSWEHEALGALFEKPRRSVTWPRSGRLEVDCPAPLESSHYFRFHQSAWDHRLFVLEELANVNRSLPDDAHMETVEMLTSQVLQDVQGRYERIVQPSAV